MIRSDSPAGSTYWWSVLVGRMIVGSKDPKLAFTVLKTYQTMGLEPDGDALRLAKIYAAAPDLKDRVLNALADVAAQSRLAEQQEETEKPC